MFRGNLFQNSFHNLEGTQVLYRGAQGFYTPLPNFHDVFRSDVGKSLVRGVVRVRGGVVRACVLGKGVEFVAFSKSSEGLGV